MPIYTLENSLSLITNQNQMFHLPKKNYDIMTILFQKLRTFLERILRQRTQTETYFDDLIRTNLKKNNLQFK